MSTAVRSRVFKISAAAVTAAIAIGLCLFSQDDVSASIKERRVERLNAQIENVYTDEYQQMMDTEIADERDAKERTVDSIYTKVNPYGTNTTSMYVYFTTDQASTVSYTVSAEGYPDYTANAITSDEAAAAYREAAAGDADGSGNVGGTSTASQTTTVSSNDIASHRARVSGVGTDPQGQEHHYPDHHRHRRQRHHAHHRADRPETARRGGSTARTGRRPPTNPRSPRSAMACTRFSAMIPTSRISCTTMTRTV